MRTYQELFNIVRDRQYNLRDINIWHWLSLIGSSQSSRLIYHWGMTTGDGSVSVRELAEDREIEVYVRIMDLKIQMSSDSSGTIDSGEIYSFKEPMTMDDLFKHPRQQKLKIFKKYIRFDDPIPGPILRALGSLTKGR